MRFGQPAESEKVSFRSRLFRMTWQQWAMLLLLGLLLVVITLPVSHDEEKEDSPFSDSGLKAQETQVQSTELEKKLETILESVEGVGRVRVLLMTGNDTEGEGFYSRESTEVTGVLISAEGADNSVTVQNIQQAVMALFQIEAHKIKIMKMK